METVEEDVPSGPAGGTFQVKVHGIFRSGTNLAKYILSGQFHCTPVFNQGGHKHLPLPCIPGVTETAWMPTVVCVKNPLANVVSLFRYAQRVRFKHFDCGRDWDAFLRKRLVVRMHGNPAWPAYRFNDPVDYWNAFYANAFSIPREHLFVLNYEALLRNPDAEMDRLAAHFPLLPRRAGRCALPEQKMSRGGDAQSQAVLDQQSFDERRWYLERHYMACFDEQQLARAARRVDREVLAAAGYTMEDLRGLLAAKVR